MATATFIEEVAGRDLTIEDDALWTTPSTDDLPNTDTATEANSGSARARFSETTDDFAIPWGTADFTIEAWFRYTATPPGIARFILGRFDTGEAGLDSEWEVIQTGDASPNVRLRLVTASSSVWAQVDSGSFAEDAWVYWVATLNSSLGAGAVSGRQLKSYLNASLASTTTTPTTALSVPTLSAPRLLLGAGATSILAGTEIGKLAIYHRILTSGEMTDHYEAMTT